MISLIPLSEWLSEVLLKSVTTTDNTIITALGEAAL